jgi:hypothetical protein
MVAGHREVTAIARSAGKVDTFDRLNGGRPPLDIAMAEFADDVEVTRIQRLVGAADDLDVLLGHRPPSIPLSGRCANGER